MVQQRSGGIERNDSAAMAVVISLTEFCMSAVKVSIPFFQNMLGSQAKHQGTPKNGTSIHDANLNFEHK